MSAQPVRIFLLDDHEVVRRGIAELLATVPDFQIVGEAGSAAEALDRVFACMPDVAVLDARLPDGSGIDVCREIRANLPSTYCLILTSHDDEDAVLAAVLAGASGYVLKEVRTGTLVDAIRQAARGRSLIEPAVIAQVMERVRNGRASSGRWRMRSSTRAVTAGSSNEPPAPTCRMPVIRSVPRICFRR